MNYENLLTLGDHSERRDFQLRHRTRSLTGKYSLIFWPLCGTNPSGGQYAIICRIFTNIVPQVVKARRSKRGLDAAGATLSTITTRRAPAPPLG